MITQQEQQLLDEIVEKLSEYEDSDFDAKVQATEEWEQTLPEGTLNDFLSSTWAEVIKIAAQNEVDKATIQKMLRALKDVKAKFERENRPDFIPEELAKVYLDLAEEEIVEGKAVLLMEETFGRLENFMDDLVNPDKNN